MFKNHDKLLTCTPDGIVTMLKESKIQLEGQLVVIIGISNIVGKPVGQVLLNENATVTYCHSKTKDLISLTSKADILIVAVRIPKGIGREHLKQDAVVIDVGINRLEDRSLVGDVDFDQVKETASFITPVPGGVGPMTIAMLLQNTLKAAKELSRK